MYDAHSGTFTFHMLISNEIISLIQRDHCHLHLRNVESHPIISCCLVMIYIVIALDQIIPQHASLT